MDETKNVVGAQEMVNAETSPSPVSVDEVGRYQYNYPGSPEPEESKSYGGVLAAVIGGTIAAAGAVGGWFAMRKAKKKAKAEETQEEESPVVVLPSQSFVIRDIDVATDDEIEAQFAALRKWRADRQSNKPEHVEGEVE